MGGAGRAGPLSLVEGATATLAASGVDAPRLEAQLLLALALGVTRTAVVAGIHAEPDAAQRARCETLIEARRRRVPLAYLRGTQEFYGLDFEVRPAVLIPRPETEMLVDFALETLGAVRGSGDSGGPAALLADVGAGSGCIAIAALAHCPGARGVAFDISRPALAVARRNARLHGVAGRLRLICADLLRGARQERFDLILSNPPYIRSGDLAELQPEVRDAEPRLALDGGADGLSVYRRLAVLASSRLAPGGRMAVEVGLGQADEVTRILRAAGFGQIEARRDLAGI
jgi:release factor glutamine methyltransferase